MELVELALVLLKTEKLEEGLAELEKAVEVEPDHPLAIVPLARYAIVHGDQDAAYRGLATVRGQVRVASRDPAALKREYAQRFRGIERK